MTEYKHGTLMDERPDLYDLLLHKEDGSIHIGSAKKVDWICPNCGSIVKQKAVDKVVGRGLPCPFCGDGVSKPEKIVASALKHSGISFEPQKIFPWSGLKRYDFYIGIEDMIIEVHGAQHYGLGFKQLSGVSLEDQQRNDKLKEDLARQNGIRNYLKINASDTSAKSIIPQLVLQLRASGIEIIANVKSCEVDSLKSNVVIAADMWNRKIGTQTIAKYLGVALGTVINYLKTAAEIGLCDYTSEESLKRGQQKAVSLRMKKVRCITTGEEFASITSAARQYGITSPSNIIRNIYNPKNHAGSYNGEPLSWEYIEE